MIELEGIVKRYDTNYAVAGVSFEIKKGEIVGFLGPNGAGKTTTMRILTGYLPADSGNAYIDGISIHEDILRIKQKIGYLPESAPQYGDMMVDEYLRYIAEARGISEESMNGRIQSIAKKVGIEDVLKKNIEELSKGYRQRVGLAQTLIHEPDVLILDEPTSGLDPIQIQEIRKLIRELGKKKTVILSTHIMQEVEAVCDRVLIISRGKIVAEGTPDELRARSKGDISLNVTVVGDTEKIQSEISKIPDVINVVKTAEQDHMARYTISSGKTIAEHVFRWAVDHGFILTELKEEQTSLEDLFLQLTQGKEGD